MLKTFNSTGDLICCYHFASTICKVSYLCYIHKCIKCIRIYTLRKMSNFDYHYLKLSVWMTYNFHWNIQLIMSIWNDFSFDYSSHLQKLLFSPKQGSISTDPLKAFRWCLPSSYSVIKTNKQTESTHRIIRLPSTNSE